MAAFLSIGLGGSQHSLADVPDIGPAPEFANPEPPAPVIAETIASAPFELRTVATHLQLPWALAFLPDGRILITERAGRLRVIDNGILLSASVEGVPQVLTGGHSGLLDVLVDRDFATTRLLYLSYMHGTPQAATIRIVRARLEGMSLIDKQVIFDSSPAITGVDQIGGRLAFGLDGSLFLTIGDRFQKERAQNLMDHAGSIIRIRTDGSVPEDNPFAGQSNVLPEIFTFGHRNPQGFVVDRSNGAMWTIEQGPYGGDELNLLEAGRNYGWPIVTHGIDYDGSIISPFKSAPGLVDPKYVWVPSIAPASLSYFRDGGMPDDWRGALLIGTLAGESLVKLTLENGTVTREERFLHHGIGRIRDVAVSPDDQIYLLTDSTDATLYRLEPLTDASASRGMAR